MLLAGDIGGTSTRLGLFDTSLPRPSRRAFRAFTTLDYPDLPTMIAAFLREQSLDGGAIDRACFGVAGPVLDDAAELTNVPWRVDAASVAAAFRLKRVHLLNDLKAMAYSVPVLDEAELSTLQQGEADPRGNVCLIAAGTGLGIALLHNADGRLIPSPSEGGHADFAARTEREIALLRDLTARFGRAEVERVVSGPGLANIHRVTHPARCPAVAALDDPDAPAAITAAALAGRCAGCVEALDMFVEAYGAAGGNLVLGGVTTGGLYIGGGIAPKILPALQTGRFLSAFRAKAPFEDLLKQVPVKVILNDEAGLLGAAVFAASL
jgi:glucokinase